MTDPKLIFADEPTGALDTQSAREILGLFEEAVHQFGQTVVMVTHNPMVAAHADSVFFLVDGRMVGELTNPTAAGVAERLTHLGADGAGSQAQEA